MSSAPVVTPATSTLERRLGAEQAAASPAVDARWLAVAHRVWPFFVIAAVALVARARYIAGYHDTYGSGDANLMLARAFFIERGELAPSAALGSASEVFGTPPLIPLLLAAIAKATPMALSEVPVVLGPVLTIAALFALYAIVTRAFDRSVAVLGVVMVALLPRYAFDSTEPDKVAYVVAFFVIALWLLYEGQRRTPLLLLSGVFMGLALFTHTTALLFVPVWVGSHIALSRGSLPRMLSPYMLGGAALAIACFGAWVALDRAYGPSPAPVLVVAGTPTVEPSGEGESALPPVRPDALVPGDDDASRFLPGPLHRYWVNVTGLAEDGFRDSAWSEYADGVRGQVLDPVFALAFGGFAVGLWLAVARRRMEVVPLLLWMAVVTIGFAIQHPAPSHTSRYPSYVTPVFVVMAVFFTIWAARQVASRFDWEPSYALALAAPVLAWMAFSYVTAPEEGGRTLYEGHAAMATYVTENDLISEDARLLYLAWPSYTYPLLEGGADEADLQAFGWQRIAFDRWDFDGLKIRYFVHDDLTDDYFHSSSKMLGTIGQERSVREVASFCTNPTGDPEHRSCSGSVKLYELLPVTDP